MDKRKLERNLINPELWELVFEYMPIQCRSVVLEPPQGLGIGWNSLLGWYIMGSGQGPGLCWIENCLEG
jgi:hypothetical protein